MGEVVSSSRPESLNVLSGLKDGEGDGDESAGMLDDWLIGGGGEAGKTGGSGLKEGAMAGVDAVAELLSIWGLTTKVSSNPPRKCENKL